ncbi:hypothetical protein L7F22_063284 [Adiantum nelumboides]|nr:hypothetical protein [Adiantum nelumboides]
MQGLKARIKELEELNHRLLAELRGKQVEGAGGSGGAGEDVVGGAGTGGEGIGGKGTKRRRERDEEDAGESALKQVFKKAKLNEFNGEKKTGEDLEAWIEELEDFFALREFSEEAKAKVAIVQLRSVAKLWWKSYMQTRSRVGPMLWEEFREQAEKRYCSPHYNMEKKMEFYNFKQREEDKHSLSVDEYKEKFLRLHKYAPEVTWNALKSKFIEGLREKLKYQVKGSGCTDFLDAVAKAENFEKMEEFTMKKAASARNRVIATGHRPQGSTVPSSRFNSNQTWVNYGQRNNNNNNQRIANNNQRPNTQVNGGQNDNQKKRQPVRWQQDSEFLERARRLGLCFRCGEQGHRTFECPNKAITAPMQAKVTELDVTIEEASEEVKEASLRFKQYIERCPRRELSQDEKLSVLFMDGFKNETLKKDLHLKAYSTFKQVTREALYLVDNCKAYKEVTEDADSIASGISLVKSEPSTKKDAPTTPTTEQLIEEITKRMQQQMRNPTMRQPQMRKCDIYGGDHPTPWCTQQPKAPVVNERVLKWCATEHKWTNHGTTSASIIKTM